MVKWRGRRAEVENRKCVHIYACANLFSHQSERGRQIDHMDKSRRWPGCAKNQLVLPHCAVWQYA